MKTYILDIIPRIQKLSKKLDVLTLLTNQHWVSLSEIPNHKVVYIFRPSNQLLVSENGVVRKENWEYLGNDALLIDTNGTTYLFKHGFFDEQVMALKLDGQHQFAVFINESKYGSELNSISDVQKFLERKYILGDKVESPKFFYLTDYGEFGPYTALQLQKLVKKEEANPLSFVRAAHENGYAAGVRIKDLLNKL